jgi:hypothetical protein
MAELRELMLVLGYSDVHTFGIIANVPSH